MPQIAMPEKEPPQPQVIPDSGNKSDKEMIQNIQSDITEEDYGEDSLIEVTERLIPEEGDVSFSKEGRNLRKRSHGFNRSCFLRSPER